MFLTTAGPALAQWDAYNKAMQSVGLKSDPAKDPICWQKQVCHAALKQQFPDADITKDNWQSPGPNNRCGSSLGVCLPAGTTQLEIKIGQTAEIKDLGDYIKTVYVYLLGIGGIVAAVLLIKSGADWMLSVGESEGIKNAQATMAGALIGLLFLLGSYTLLYTINPDLVNLKLPQVYMVRPPESNMAEGSFCRTEGPLLAACAGLGQSGEYNCRPFLTKGPMTLFTEGYVVVVSSFLPLPGEAVVGAILVKTFVKSGVWVAKTTGKLVGKYAAAAFGAPAKKIMQSWASLGAEKIALESGYGGVLWKKVLDGDMALAEQIIAKDVSGIQRKLFGEAVVATFKEGKTIGWNAIKTAGYTGGAGYGAYFLSSEVYDLLKGNEPGYPGSCEKSFKLSKGEFCNTLANPSDCAEGKCMKVGDFGGWTTGADLGVCSSGGVNSPCETKNDCNGAEFECIEKVCSNGTFDSACKEDKDCKGGLECKITGNPLLSWSKSCVKISGAGSGEACLITSKSGDAGSCQDGFDCVKAPVVNSGPQGLCTDHKTNSPCFKDDQCESSFCFDIIPAMPDLAKPGTCTLK